MLNERRRRVLQALVEEYISSAQPVGSRTLVERYELGCSPATVRNELSILEETGYVVQPHISAGRLPTDTGYRDFVDRLLEEGMLTRLEPAAIPQASEVDELMRVTSAMLTQLTDSLAVVLAPSVSLVKAKRMHLLSMSSRRALFVLITESGHVLNRHIELPEATPPERLHEVERALNAALVGKRASEIRPLYEALKESVTDANERLLRQVMAEILDLLGEADRERLYHVGVPALLAQPEFHDSERARPLIECVENGLAMLEALSEAMTTRRMTVKIGHENRRVELGSVSIVATNYGNGSNDGVIGVIGPTRMDYQRAIAAVRAVADGLTEALE
jgi:heat-inducible transcriptional repressor